MLRNACVYMYMYRSSIMNIVIMCIVIIVITTLISLLSITYDTQQAWEASAAVRT